MRGRTVGPKTTITPTQKYGNTVGQRFRPLREFQGRERHGDGTYTDQTREMWVDLVNRKKVPAAADWNDSPPDLPSGDAGRELRCQPPSEIYRQHYAAIDWSK